MKSALMLCAILFSPFLGLADAVVGKPAPDFTGKDIDGKTHKLSDYKGKIVVLEAHNPDCPFCAHHYKTGAMQELQEWAKSKGAVWLLVNSSSKNSGSYRDPVQAKKEFTKDKIRAAAWLDDNSGEIGKAFGLKTTPHMIVIGKDGNVAYDGAIDDRADTETDPRKARNYVKEAIEKLSANQPVTVAKTKSYGCGVKYAN